MVHGLIEWLRLRVWSNRGNQMSVSQWCSPVCVWKLLYAQLCKFHYCDDIYQYCPTMRELHEWPAESHNITIIPLPTIVINFFYRYYGNPLPTLWHPLPTLWLPLNKTGNPYANPMNELMWTEMLVSVDMEKLSKRTPTHICTTKMKWSSGHHHIVKRSIGKPFTNYTNMI